MHLRGIAPPGKAMLLLWISCPLGFSQAQEEERRESLPETTITADVTDSSIDLQVAEAQQELTSIPGGTSLILEDQYRDGPAANISDVLRLAPGVYIQSRFGGSETRLSVRGSGIRQTFNTIGVRLLRNGLPLSESDGNVRSQLVDPLIIQYAEVLPGANGLAYGSALLGGAINFITPTGYTADPLRIRLAGGTDEFTQMQVSSGNILDNGHDYFVSGSILDADHFRDNSEERFTNFYGNYGIPLGDEWIGRMHGTYIDSELELPGSLTWDQLEDDPRQANPASEGINSSRNFDVYRVDLEAIRDRGPGEKLQFGLSYQYLSMIHPLPSGLNLQRLNEIGLSGRSETEAELFGTDNELVFGVFASTGDDQSKRNNIATDLREREVDSQATTIDAYAEDRLVLDENFRLVGGAVATFAGREQDTTVVSGPPNVTDGDEDYFGVSPKVGFLWDTSDEVQVYSSVAASFEPPTNGNISNSTQPELDAQTAWTLEVGGRGDHRNTTWQATTFYSLVDDELLTVESPPGSGNTDTGNADETIHWGVELGANQFFPFHNMESDDGRSDGLRLSGVYNYLNIEFDDDELWGDNDIPGVPDHHFYLELVYEQPRGFYFGVDMELASDWFVDFANSEEAENYEVFGAKSGYDFGKWRWFLDARNLFNKEYASNSGITADATPTQTIYNPGTTFAIVTGLEFYL